MNTNDEWALIEFAENPEDRCALVVLADTSISMSGEKIDSLNAGLHILRESLLADPLAAKRVETAVVSFDSFVTIASDFATADSFEPPKLVPDGLTHMGSGILKALDLVDARKRMYNENGVGYYRPWVFLITDGSPMGEDDSVLARARQRLQAAEANRQVVFFAVGVEDADMSVLNSLGKRHALKLNSLNFTEMFQWLSRSAQAVAHSQTSDDQIALPAAGWGAA